MILSEGALCRLATFSKVLHKEAASDSTWISRKPIQAGLGYSTERLFQWAAGRESTHVDTIVRDVRFLDDPAALNEGEERQLVQAVRYTRCPIALSRLERSFRARVIGIASRFQCAGVSWPTLLTEARRAFFDAVNTFDFDSTNTLSLWVEASLGRHLDEVLARDAQRAALPTPGPIAIGKRLGGFGAA